MTEIGFSLFTDFIDELKKIPNAIFAVVSTSTREHLLEACPEARTVPQIVIDGTVIGGYDQLEEYFKL